MDKYLTPQQMLTNAIPLDTKYAKQWDPQQTSQQLLSRVDMLNQMNKPD